MVDFGSHIRRGHPAAFGLLAFISLVVGIISGALTSNYKDGHVGDVGGIDFGDSSLVSRVHFMVFVGWWTFVFSVVYVSVARTWQRGGSGGACKQAQPAASLPSRRICSVLILLLPLLPPTFHFPPQLGLFLSGIGGVVTSIAGHGIWLLLTWIFWLAGAGAMASILGGNCSDKSYYYCNSLRALEAFGWIGWVLLTLMLIVVGAIGGGAFRGGRGLKDGLSEA